MESKNSKPAGRNPWKKKNVILPSDFPYARDLKRAEGKERGKELLSCLRQGQECTATRSQMGRISMVGGEHATRAGNTICEVLIPIVITVTKKTKQKKTNKKQPSACKQQTTGSHILLFVSLQSRKMMGTTGTNTKLVPTVRRIHISFTSSEARLLHKLPETLASCPKSTYSANSINVIIKSQYI